MSLAHGVLSRWGWALLLASGGACALTGLLPVPALVSVLERVLPVLVFLVGITLVAEIAAAAGVFDQAAGLAARWGGGRTWRLWLLVALLATTCTIVLSLDTTAVLLTPVVLVLARATGVSTALMAMTTVWLAATASLLLPVSNLTNLLAAHRLDVGVPGYVSLVLAPAVAAVAVTLAVLAVMFRDHLRGGYLTYRPPAAADPIWCAWAAVLCLALVPAFVLGVPVAAGVVTAAALLVVVTAWRSPASLGTLQLPWRMALGALGLFLLVDAAVQNGLSAAVALLAGSGGQHTDLLRLTVVSALAANLVNNLPAYLAMEASADGSPTRLVAVLVGVGVGPVLTPWASLATLLWADRCRAAGVSVDWWRFLRRGLVLLPVLLVATTATLLLPP